MRERRRKAKVAAAPKAKPRTQAEASKALSRALARAARASLVAYRARAGGTPATGPKSASLLTLAGGATAVAFTCNNFPSVLVSISTYSGSAVLQPGATFHLPSGDHPIAWAAQGTAGAVFQVGVVGGTLNMPIGGILPAGGNGGPRILTVP